MKNEIKEKLVRAKVNVILDVNYYVLAETDEDAIKYVMENYDDFDFMNSSVYEIKENPYNINVSDYDEY